MLLLLLYAWIPADIYTFTYTRSHYSHPIYYASPLAKGLRTLRAHKSLAIRRVGVGGLGRAAGAGPYVCGCDAQRATAFGSASGTRANRARRGTLPSAAAVLPVPKHPQKHSINYLCNRDSKIADSPANTRRNEDAGAGARATRVSAPKCVAF